MTSQATSQIEQEVEQETALVPFLQRGRIILAKETFSFAEVQDAVLDPVNPHAADEYVQPFPKVPAPVAMTDEVKGALARVAEVFNSVPITSRRALTPTEITSLFHEQETLRIIAKDLTARDEAIKEAIRTHQDVIAEVVGAARPAPVRDESGEIFAHATPRVKDGHYLLAAKNAPAVTEVPGTNKAYSNEYRTGSISINQKTLTTLAVSNEITRLQYLALTREVRVFDEAKATAAVVKDPSLLTVIRAISERTPPTVALNIRTA